MTDVNYFDGQNAAGNGNTSGGSWVALLAGLGAVALGAYALLRGGKTSSSGDTGLSGYIESLGGGSGEELPGKGSGSTGGSGNGDGNRTPALPSGDGSAIAAFAQSYDVKPESVANVFRLSNYGDEEINSILGVKYQTYLNTDKMIVTDASGNLVSLGSDLDPVLGLGKTIIFHQEKGEGLAGTPDSNALAKAGLLGGAIAGVSREEAPIAAATSLAKWFDSLFIKDSSKRNQAAAMGLVWSPQTGLTSRQSAVAAQQTAQNAAVQKSAEQKQLAQAAYNEKQLQEATRKQQQAEQAKQQEQQYRAYVQELQRKQQEQQAISAQRAAQDAAYAKYQAEKYGSLNGKSSQGVQFVIPQGNNGNGDLALKKQVDSGQVTLTKAPTGEAAKAQALARIQAMRGGA